MLVDPARSQKTIVTSFRAACGASSGTSFAPQNPQRRNFSGFSSPQLGQTLICCECTRRLRHERGGGPNGRPLSFLRLRVGYGTNVPCEPAGAGRSLFPWPGTLLPGTPFTVSVEYANVRIANPIASALTSSAWSVLLANVSQAAW